MQANIMAEIHFILILYLEKYNIYIYSIKILPIKRF